MAAYVAVGVWHHWLVRRDERFVADDVADGPGRPRLRLLAAAAVRWHRLVAGVVGGRPGPGQPRRRCWPARRASTTRCAPASTLAELLDDPQPEWELAAGRLGHALREHRDRFLDKSTFSMDWYYPVLGGAVRGDAGARPDRQPLARLRGARPRGALRRHRPVGHRRRDLRAGPGPRRARRPRGARRACFADTQHLRNDDGGYWTGYVYPDEVHWPAEHTTFTTAAVLLAHDALAGGRPGADLVRGAGLVPDPEPLAWSAAARQPTRSPAAPDERRSTRSEPDAPRPRRRRRSRARAGRRRTAGGRRRRGRGTRRGSRAARPCITQRAQPW